MRAVSVSWTQTRTWDSLSVKGGNHAGAKRRMAYAYWRTGSGGTKMVCSIGNSGGRVLQRASFQTLTPDVTVPQVVDFIGKFDVNALGIGSFGPLDLNPASPTYGNITKTPKKSGSIIR